MIAEGVVSRRVVGKYSARVLRDGAVPIGHNLSRRWVMHEVIEQQRAKIEALCRGLGIRRLDLFGSAVGGSLDPDSSDVDVLVEFDIRPGFDYFGTYFGLKEGLERILGRR